jgi:hypothetical protein
LTTIKPNIIVACHGPGGTPSPRFIRILFAERRKRSPTRCRAGQYAASGDGQKFLIIDNAALGVGRPLTAVQNWTALLRK